MSIKFPASFIFATNPSFLWGYPICRSEDEGFLSEELGWDLKPFLGLMMGVTEYLLSFFRLNFAPHESTV